MNKTLLVIGAASIAAALFILACTMYAPLGALFTAGKTFVLGLLGQAGSFVASNPWLAFITTPVSTAVAAILMKSSGLSKQNEIATSASQERVDILNQTGSLLTEKDSKILSLETKVDDLTKKVADTTELKTEIASLQTKLTAAQQETQRIQAEYNMAVRVKAIQNSFPVENPTVH